MLRPLGVCLTSALMKEIPWKQLVNPNNLVRLPQIRKR